MDEIRLARRGEIPRQKEIWKICFGDHDDYINFYYNQRYKENETVVLLHEGQISAMLTMIPVRTVTPDHRSFNSAMIYAVATDPQYRNRGFASRILDYSSRYLGARETHMTILVPADRHLFDFYRRQGYREGFYLREAWLTREQINSWPDGSSCKCTVWPVSPGEYNRRRNQLLKGRLHVAYADDDIAYQKKLSVQTGADVYAIDIDETQGCAVIERLAEDKVLFKEILLPREFIGTGIKALVQLLEAWEYIVRTPAYLGQDVGGLVRPYGMFRVQQELALSLTSADLGYMGLGFD